MRQNHREVWLGRYEPLAILGQGGYGVVYEALDHATGERVALKELTHVSAATVARFKQEFRAVQEVHHANLVRLDHLIEERGTWLIAMELVPGDDLLTYLYDDESPLGFDEARVRAAFLQLTDGLAALHTASLLHRDLKPPNVRVTPGGRVVVLDFGLTTAFDDKGLIESGTLGTLAYMAPEQTLGHKLGPAADWYAFGVCLFEALTGVRPFEGQTANEMLEAKLHLRPDAPSAIAPGIPQDLNALSLALLSVNPEARPDAGTIRRVLAPQRASSPVLSRAPANANLGSFEGRDPELAQLTASYDAVRSGQPAGHRVVLISGESGIGKSALVEHFLRNMARSSGGPAIPRSRALMLRSRCYENEMLAFKAFDGALEQLVRVLEALPPEQLTALLPRRAALLCRLFPTLEGFAPLAQLPLDGVAADPRAQRLEAFSIFRRLLSRLSELAPIVLIIDDLQWADAESFRLLHAVLSGPQPVRCLVVATLRPPGELEADTALSLAHLRAAGSVIDLALSGLPQPQALRLARQLLPVGLPERWLDSMVRESAGHPLFLTVLARYIQTHTPEAPRELTLEAALDAQLSTLSAAGRQLVETAAVAGMPLPAALFRRAAGLSEDELGPLIAELCAQRLLRRRGAGDVTCFHDRIRSLVVSELQPSQARDLHSRLAEALAAQPHTDPAVLARHHEAAGEAAQAYGYYQQAAERAQASLAFARAATLFKRTLVLATALSRPVEEQSALLLARAHALADSGRSGEAANDYLQAAERAEGEERTRLRILATQHLLQGAHVAAGLAAAHTLLAELGIHLPKRLPFALARLLWDRAVLGWTGLDIPKKPAPIDALARMRMDALWGLSQPLGWADPVANVSFVTRHLRLAHAHGEPTQMAQALAEEAFARAMRFGERGGADRLLARARELCGPRPSPALEAHLSFREGTIATLLWNLSRARERLECAERLGTEQCPDQPWLLTNVRTTLGNVLSNLGEYNMLADLTNGWLAEARDRNDRFTIAAIEGLGCGTYRHLMRDRPDRATEELSAALEPWPLEPFTFARLGDLIGSTLIELYRGGDHAARWFEQAQPRLSRALLLKLRATREPVRMLEANACIAASTVASGSQAKRLLTRARKLTRGIDRERSKFGQITRLGLEAQLAALDRDTEGALAILRVMRELPATRENPMALRLLDCLEGKLEGGDGGKAKLEHGLAFFADQGWQTPERAVGLMWPAFPIL